MASDLSETIDIVDEKEEGEISLDDVSSSEEGHQQYDYGYKGTQCATCTSMYRCAPWCSSAPVKLRNDKSYCKIDVIHGKENRHKTKENHFGSKCTTSKLQEKNDDLVPISSDSDMEIVGSNVVLTEKHSGITMIQRKRKRRRKRLTESANEDIGSSSSVDSPVPKSRDSVNNSYIENENYCGRSDHRDLSPTHKHFGRYAIPSIPQYRYPFRGKTLSRKSRSPPKDKSPKRNKFTKIMRSEWSHSRSPIRESRKLAKSELLPSSASEIHKDVTKLLKKVRHLDSVGTQFFKSTAAKNKEHTSSLKDKLSNILHKQPDNNENDAIHQNKVKKLNVKVIHGNSDADDDDDIALLRQKALETKQKKSKCEKQLVKASDNEEMDNKQNQNNLNCNDEDLELRMIALRSAVLKKHANRVRRGMTARKNKKVIGGSESPLSQSYLDNSSFSSSCVVKLSTEIAEDVEVDANIEGEQEKLPYSPTDTVTSIATDTEMLGIQSSDVSFIRFDSALNQSHINLNFVEKLNSNNSDNDFNLIDATNENRPYSPSDPIEVLKPKFLFNDAEYEDYIKNFDNEKHQTKNIIGSPCSPSNSVYDLDQSKMKFKLNQGLEIKDKKYIEQGNEINNSSVSDKHSEIIVSAYNTFMNTSEINFKNVSESDDKNISLINGSNNNRKNEQILENVIKPINNYLIKESQASNSINTVKENKISTLFNRVLLPTSILKCNKHLQQPFAAKKKEPTVPEPTFKNADMQPIAIESEINSKSSTLFKPIKINSVAKKSHSILITSNNAFNDLLVGESVHESLSDKSPTSNDSVRESESVSIEQNRKPSKEENKQKGVINLSSKVSQNIQSDVENDDLSNNKNKYDNFDTINALKLDEEKRDESSENIKHPMPSNNQVNRRLSMDEDEDKLRAIVLASLRTKTTSSNSSQCMKDSELPSETIIKSTASMQSTPVINTVNDVTIVNTVNNNGLSLSKHSITKSTEENKSQTSNNATSSYLETTKEKLLNSSNNVETSSLVPIKKRQTLLAKSPIRKTSRKIIIPASAKVVNNAKKFQNNIIQRKLNSRRATALYTNHKSFNFTSFPNKSIGGNKWSANPKTLVLPETQRLIINLNSDSESGSDSDTQSPVNHTQGVEKAQNNSNPKDLERSVDQFLRDIRKKQESATTILNSTPNYLNKDKLSTIDNKGINNANIIRTPLAVRHLSASKQEEYRRLKQEIAEREKLQKKRVLQNNVKSASIKQSTNSPNMSAPIHEVITQSKSIQQKDRVSECDSEKISVIETPKLQRTEISTTSGSHTSNKNAKNISPAFEKMKNLSIQIQNVSPLNSSSSKRKVIENSSISMNCNLNEINTNSSIKKNIPEQSNPQITIENNLHSNSNRIVTLASSSSSIKSTVESNYICKKDNSFIECNSNLEETGNSSNSFTITQKEKSSFAHLTIDNTNIVDSDASTVILPRSDYSEHSTNIESDASTVNLLRSTNEEEQMENISNYGYASLDHSSLISLEDDEKIEESEMLSSKETIREHWHTLKKDVKTELDTILTLPKIRQEKILKDSENILIEKRQKVLDDLSEMSDILQQWDMERDLQTNLVAKVKKLREQLKLAEEKLESQRKRIKSMSPKVISAHKKIHKGRYECCKLSRICSGLGYQIDGVNYKIPEKGSQLVDEKFKEVAVHIRRLSKKKVPAVDPSESNYEQVDIIQMKEIENEKRKNDDNKMDVDHETVSKLENKETSENIIEAKKEDIQVDTQETQVSNIEIMSDATTVDRQIKRIAMPYKSILTQLKLPRNSNPNAILCPYELMGTCSDGDCQFLHPRSSGMK